MLVRFFVPFVAASLVTLQFFTKQAYLCVFFCGRSRCTVLVPEPTAPQPKCPPPASVLPQAQPTSVHASTSRPSRAFDENADSDFVPSQEQVADTLGATKLPLPLVPDRVVETVLRSIVVSHRMRKKPDLTAIALENDIPLDTTPPRTC